MSSELHRTFKTKPNPSIKRDALKRAPYVKRWPPRCALRPTAELSYRFSVPFWRLTIYALYDIVVYIKYLLGLARLIRTAPTSH
jgi:hypothetical protein